LACYVIPPFKVDYNVYVPILKKYYKIIAADDINKILGWNSTSNVFARGASNQVAPGANTGYQPVGELNPSEDEMLRITGIGIGSFDLSLQVKQPTGVDRFGTPSQAIGDLDGVTSPPGNPKPLHFFYVVANKQPSIQATNNSSSQYIRPELYVTGYRFKWELMETTPPQFQVIHIGGIQ
jgi:hypothetical protein